MPHRRFIPSSLRVAAGTVMVMLSAALLVGAPSAAAAPADTVLPIPVFGVATGPTGLGGPLVAQHVKARTDPDSPGSTRFVGAEYGCLCLVHWRNLSTGATGATGVGRPFDPRAVAVTGPGVLVATVTVSGLAGSPITVLPGAGAWIVP
ncbi:hypothetical protein JWS13_04540 (plasmid) [Rhodococcus pseudokoreensis]|uniref:Secreted protein n=1 Tax=Rhodococcus pseudokoreensis TaxID=2811421 RepID=A0A974VZX9_9NOCA|nr:hypothetical protein [Rhodococcus pseudokoreensis]QSE87888.1 hypothetical protein JWS13_04540 [Rhodococcus pseudokoreensis]